MADAPTKVISIDDVCYALKHFDISAECEPMINYNKSIELGFYCYEPGIATQTITAWAEHELPVEKGVDYKLCLTLGDDDLLFMFRCVEINASPGENKYIFRRVYSVRAKGAAQ